MGSRLVSEIYEKIDEEIFKSLVRKGKYYVEQKDMPRSLVDVMCTLNFKRRGYVPKKGGEYIYLLELSSDVPEEVSSNIISLLLNHFIFEK